MSILGPFKHYKYTSDSGALYTIRQRGACGDAVSNPAEAAGSHPNREAGWKLRHVELYNVTGGVTTRKSVVICDPTNAIYVSGTGPISIDSLAWNVGGRIGEKRVTI